MGMTADFPEVRPLLPLLAELRRVERFDPDLFRAVLAAARDGQAMPWESRRVAVLMLEHLLLKIPSGRMAKFDLALSALGIKEAEEPGVRSDLLLEGYTATDLRSFVPQLRRRLKRLEWVHRCVATDRGLFDFLSLARKECRLSLARYVFTPEDVAKRILSQVRVSDGVMEVVYNAPPLPPYEREILDLLCGDARVLWVECDTGAGINSLVEYPIGTVVLVVKPPGSDIEFEFKRAGTRDVRPLNAVFEREGKALAAPHRLHGGGLGMSLAWQARQEGALNATYRAVHGRAAPISQTLQTVAVNSVPTEVGPVHLLDYFTAPHDHGFEDMRTAMRRSLEALQTEPDSRVPESGLSLTVEFLTQYKPRQSVLAGTSSFRLDRLADYLSADGPALYFGPGFGLPCTAKLGKCFADELLDEVLGTYSPCQAPYRSHKQYVDAAFSIPANRRRADANFLACMEEIGVFWGTLLALGGYSYGESFVARNTGLRCVWERGEWRVKILFMDHDNLHLPDEHEAYFDAVRFLDSIYVDESFIFGSLRGYADGRGLVECLHEVYRAKDRLRELGNERLRDSMQVAAARTRSQLGPRGALRPLLAESLILQLEDFERIVKMLLHEPGWRESAAAALRGKDHGFGPEEEFLNEMAGGLDFFRRHAFLYEA
jgi:hypothetical protein